MKPATTVTKVCRILGEFRTRPSMGVTEVARRTELRPSDAHRILQSLIAFGFIEQNPENKTYRLGMSVMKLGLTVFQRHEVREAARPCLQRLSEETEATAHMALFDPRELEIFLAEQIDSTSAVEFKTRYGPITNPHCSALGKAIIANIHPDSAMLLLRKTGMSKSTKRTITGMRELDAELHRISSLGYGLDLEESAEGACCVGAPIQNWSGSVLGAISVSMPASRFYRLSEAHLASMVKAAAARVSASLGYKPAEGAQRPHISLF